MLAGARAHVHKNYFIKPDGLLFKYGRICVPSKETWLEMSHEASKVIGNFKVHKTLISHRDLIRVNYFIKPDGLLFKYGWICEPSKETWLEMSHEASKVVGNFKVHKTLISHRDLIRVDKGGKKHESNWSCFLKKRHFLRKRVIVKLN